MFHMCDERVRLAFAQSRLNNEYRQLCDDPIPGIHAKPLVDDLLRWGFVLDGAKGTPFEGGTYYGELTFTTYYPQRAPQIKVYTPNGKFVPGSRICLIPDGYRFLSWDSTWTIGAFLSSFAAGMMYDDHLADFQTSEEQKRLFAKRSMQYNRTNSNFMKAFSGDHFLNTALADLSVQENGLTAADTTTSNVATTTTPATATEEKKADEEEESELSSYTESDDEALEISLKWSRMADEMLNIDHRSQKLG